MTLLESAGLETFYGKSQVLRGVSFPVLRERWRQRGRSLSGGEQQMLAIARALAGNPDLLMLDEPSQGLAPLLVQELGNLVIRLKGEGETILLVEQNVRMALAVTDQ